MKPLTPEERKDMIAGLDAFIAEVDETLAVAYEFLAYEAEYQKEVAAREAQEELNAECIAAIEGREPAA